LHMVFATHYFPRRCGFASVGTKCLFWWSSTSPSTCCIRPTWFLLEIHSVCMCIFPCKSCCDHNTVCRVYISMKLLWSEVHTSLHAMCNFDHSSVMEGDPY
jgi:hypothetical protein